MLTQFDSNDPRPNAGCAMGQVSINGHCYDYVAYGGFCEYSKQCNYLGSICFQKRCVCPPGQLYNGKQCINDPNIPNGNYGVKIDFNEKDK
uniref:EB domain-containing protein n=1 Tax=Meloidogyne floridensis TaxID=298350 RepID=A0A915NDN6_9BILA